MPNLFAGRTGGVSSCHCRVAGKLGIGGVRVCRPMGLGYNDGHYRIVFALL